MGNVNTTISPKSNGGNNSGNGKIVAYNRNQEFGDFNASLYTGTWWEIARCNNSYQKGCQRSRAEYELNNNGTLSVNNFCYADGAVRDSIMGTARVVNPGDPAALHVSFEGIPDFLPNAVNYIVYETDYSNYAIVSSPPLVGGPPGADMGACVWILSRYSEISPDDYTYLLGRVKAQNLDTGLIQFQDLDAINADVTNRLVPNVVM